MKEPADTPVFPLRRTAKKKGRVRRQRIEPSQQRQRSSYFQQRLFEYRWKIAAIGIGGMAIGMLLALLSYSPADVTLTMLSWREIGGLILGDPKTRLIVETIHNWLGIVGALLADLLINQMFGYPAIVIPVVLAAWSYWCWKEQIPKKLPFLTGVAFSVMLLSSTTFGIVILATDTLSPAWSGTVGEFFASILRALFGTLGAILIVVGIATVIGVLLVGEQPVIVSLQRWMKQLRKQLRQKRDSESAKLDRLHVGEDKPATQSEIVVAPLEEEEPVRIVRARLQRVQARRSSVEAEEQVANAEEISGDDKVVKEAKTVPRSPVAKQPREQRLKSRPEEKPLKLHVEPVKQEKAVEKPKEIANHPLDETIVYHPPTIELLDPPQQEQRIDEEELRRNAEILREKLRTFKVEIENIRVTPGPVVTQYEFVPAAGVKVSQIENLADDIALALKARGIRIIAPVPGKGTVAVEIPNHQPAIVRFREIIQSPKFQNATMQLPIAMGKTTIGEVFIVDLAQMPHLLIAGATGSGKSVGINVIIASLLYKLHPRSLKFLIIDPKKVELAPYRKLANHFLAVCPDVDDPILTTPEQAIAGLRSVELEMERRYDILAKVGQRNIQDYNRKVREKKLNGTDEIVHRELPYIVVIIDELADLMMTASKEVEEPITRLAQLARAVGIHLVVATQRPSVDVITGLIKANFPARIAYQVATKVDSRTILDMNGAEQLIGRGDMLMMTGHSPKPVRLQNAFLSIEEVEAICDYIASQPGYSRPYQLPSLVEKSREEVLERSGERDELFDIAARLVVQHQQGSVSLLQRRLKIGYARAARIMDQLEEAGIVGPFEGSKARVVYVQTEEELQKYL